MSGCSSPPGGSPTSSLMLSHGARVAILGRTHLIVILQFLKHS
jgi:hypothetical protein